MGISDIFQLFDEYGIGTKITDSDMHKFSPIMIDASIMINRALKALKSIGVMSDAHGHPTGHIKNMLQNIIKYYKNGCRVIVIFDGKPPVIKDDELEERAKVKTSAKEELDKLQEFTDELAEFCTDTSFIEQLNNKASLEKKALSLGPDIINPIKEMLSAMGVPYIQSEEESDITIYQLYKQGIAKCVWSTDSDMLIYGVPYLIKPVTIKGEKTNRHELRLYSLQDIYNKMGINHDQLIIIAMCLGSDYDKGINRIGVKTIVKYIRENKLNAVTQKYTNKQKNIVMRFTNPPLYNLKVVMDNINLDKLEEFLKSKEFRTADKYIKNLREMDFNYRKFTKN